MVLTLLRCDWRSRHSLNLSDAKLKPITTWSPAFSRALDSLFGFTLSSHWYLEEFFFPPNGGCDYFVVGLLTLNRKALSLVTNKASLYHTQKKLLYLGEQIWNLVSQHVATQGIETHKP